MRSLFGKVDGRAGRDGQHVRHERLVALIHDRVPRLGLLERAARRRFEVDDRLQAIGQVAAAAPRSATPGRRSVGERAVQLDAAADRSVPGGMRLRRRDTKGERNTDDSGKRRTTKDSPCLCPCCIIQNQNTSCAAPRLSVGKRAVSRVLCWIRQLEQQIALNGIAAADLDARDRRVPRRRGGGAGDLAEAEMIDARGRVEAGPDLVAALDRRGEGAPAGRDERAPHGRQRPPAEDRFGAQEVVVARVLDVAAPRRLREVPVVPVAHRAARRGRADERAARARRADDQPGAGMTHDASGDLLSRVVVVEQRIRDRAGRHRRCRFDQPAGRAWTCTPVSQRNALASGTPRSGARLPIEKFDSQPRPRMRSSSSALAGSASGRSDVRY